MQEQDWENTENEETSSSDSSIFLIKSINDVSQLEDLGNKIMLDLKINGRKIEALPDTGSAIPVIPKKMSKWIMPVDTLHLPKEKRFQDINQNPLKLSFRCKIFATLKNTKSMTVWWEADEVEIPMLGMDNFKKLQ